MNILIQEIIEKQYNANKLSPDDDFFKYFQEFIQCLNNGQIRAAEKKDEKWQINEWVKKGILLGFKYGSIKDYSIPSSFSYFDKSTYPLRPVKMADQVRIVPGGTSIRTGCYIAPGVVIIPPSYINVGAYIDEKSMVDSHALVGSCAQIGKRVHISAAAQIGGVLEPVGALPVIIEDDVLIGGNCGVYEGIIVKKGAVLAAGTVLTSSVPVYDLANNKIIRKSKNNTLVIPENAVVISGSRPIINSDFAEENNLHINCAIIVKYRDQRTDAATALEDALR